MRYFIQYPLFFILTKEGQDDLALVDLQEGSSKVKGIPIDKMLEQVEIRPE
jgi:hypothetical protein